MAKIVHLCTKKNQHCQDLGFSPCNSCVPLIMAKGKQPAVRNGSHQIMTANLEGAFSVAWQSYHISLNSSLFYSPRQLFHIYSLLKPHTADDLISHSPKRSNQKKSLPCALITNHIYHILFLPTYRQINCLSSCPTSSSPFRY